MPATRENWIDAGSTRPDPWTPEDEAELPDELREGAEALDAWDPDKHYS